MQPEERLIVALDVPDAERALALAHTLRGRCRWVKVGLELFCAAGLPLVDALRSQHFEVFLDLKFHDIPNTVAGAIKSVSQSGAALLTVHGAGGPSMLHAAAEAARNSASAPRLLAVTVLTSMDAAELHAIGVSTEPADQVLRLASLATQAGIPGLVCSAQEVALLRQHLGTEPTLVVPGIRARDAPAGDQRRIATAYEAIQAGATMLVVGRPITRAADPRLALESFLSEIAHAQR